MNLSNKTLAFIGAGNMAEALIRGLLTRHVVDPAQLIATDIRAERLAELAQRYGIRTGPPAAADVVILAVKPQQISAALAQVSGEPLLVSIAAGITTTRIERELGGQPRVVRVMPNTPALVGAGAAALCAGRYATEADLEIAEAVLGAVGLTVRVPEELMDAVTALSGSGPAYIFYVAEAMISAGIQAGLSAELSRQLTLQTIAGAARLLTETAESPAELRRKVTSPGGTTEAALRVLAERGLPAVFADAIRAARDRARELAGQ